MRFDWDEAKNQEKRDTSRTNWRRLKQQMMKSIDYSDIPPLTEESFERATLRISAPPEDQLVQIDPDILKWF
ncbi:MAG: hypothetical protein QNJ46_04685 [Leptolyngbyaceae cyanobacterium MO_188.B28]|nr:hypothetical protein [Leptolyngbyaceae cyanobacterium MO_188.B28]